MLVITAVVMDRGNGWGDGGNIVDGDGGDGGASGVCGPFPLEVFEEVEVFHHRTGHRGGQ
jgi:hypothetical protein